MSKIKNITDYFFHHQFSYQMVKRVHARLSDWEDEQEKNEILKKLWEEVGSPETTEQAEKAFLEVEKKLGVEMQPHKAIRVKKNIRFPHWKRTVAMWLIPLISVLFSYYIYITPGNREAIAYIEHYVPAGKCEQIVLPDGSNVRLNSGTLLVYPSVFSKKNREVYLVGEGFFEIEKRSGYPFVVTTQTMQIDVLGAKFNLSAYPEATNITTTLESGSIKVSVKNEPENSYVLKPDEQLIYCPESGKVELIKVTATKYSDWK